MQDEWTNVGRGGQLVKFTYSDELLEGEVFLTAQIAGHEVVCYYVFSSFRSSELRQSI